MYRNGSFSNPGLVATGKCSVPALTGNTFPVGPTGWRKTGFDLQEEKPDRDVSRNASEVHKVPSQEKDEIRHRVEMGRCACR